MTYLRVKNWKKFQHYGNRTPTWIKVYTSLLENRDYLNLPDSAKAHLIGIWLLTSRMGNGKTPTDQNFIAARLGNDTPINLNMLIEKGFLEEVDENGRVIDDASSQLLGPIAITERGGGEKGGVGEGREEERREEEKKRRVEKKKASEIRLLVFVGEKLKITETQDRALHNAFPWVESQAEYRKMDSWLVANPHRCIKRFQSFAHNWFSKIPAPLGERHDVPLLKPQSR